MNLQVSRYLAHFANLCSCSLTRRIVVVPSKMDEAKKFRLYVPFSFGEVCRDTYEHLGNKWYITVSCGTTIHLACNPEKRNTLWNVTARILVGYESKPKGQYPTSSDAFVVSPFNPTIDVQFNYNKNIHEAAVNLTGDQMIIDPDEQKFLAIEIEILSMIGNSDRVYVDLDPRNSKVPHDRVLLLQNVKVYVDSSYLSFWSEFFRGLFNTDPCFKESNMTEIELKDIEPEEFIEMLAVIYPTCKQVNEGNVDSLLYLADRFIMPALISLCSRFLHSPDACNISIFDKLYWARKYTLTQVQEECMRELPCLNMNDMIDENQQAYEALSDADKVIVLQSARQQNQPTRKRVHPGDCGPAHRVAGSMGPGAIQGPPMGMRGHMMMMAQQPGGMGGLRGPGQMFQPGQPQPHPMQQPQPHPMQQPQPYQQPYPGQMQQQGYQQPLPQQQPMPNQMMGQPHPQRQQYQQIPNNNNGGGGLYLVQPNVNPNRNIHNLPPGSAQHNNYGPPAPGVI